MNAVTQPGSSPPSLEGWAASLQSVQMQGQLDGLLLRMSTRQHYKNTTLANLEAIYTFPLPWGATLLNLNAEINGHRLQATVMEKKQATQRYEKAIDDGDTPIMVERCARGLYTANLGNLQPGEDAVIELEYAQLLRFEQGQIRITVPTTVGPRYGDAHTNGGLAVHESVSASVLAQYPLTVKITLTGDLALAAVQCPSHAVALTRLEEATVVTLQPGGFLDRDFVVLLQGLQGQSFATVAPDGEGFAVLASFCPTWPNRAPAPAPVRLKVLVDCSGSMGGDSITAARKALHEVMKELTEHDWVSYSRFGSGVQHETAGLQACHAATLQHMAKLIDATGADLGGTEMNAALISTFELDTAQGFRTPSAKANEPTHNQDVLLITDGDIWHVEAVIQLAQRSGHRVFAIGVGSAPAESLLREVAEKSGGACELVSPHQEVAAVIVRMFHRIRSTRCTAVQVNWGQTAQWQSALPDALYGGDTLHLCARLTHPPEAAPQLSWVAQDTPMQASARQLQSQPTHLLARLVTAQQIEQLNGTVESQTRSLALALHYQLLTDQTHLLLVHVRPDGQKAQSLPQLDRVSHMLAAGWGGVGSVVPGSGVSSPVANYNSRATPSVWRARSVGAVALGARASLGVDGFEIPAFLRKQDDGAEPTATPQDSGQRVPQQLARGARVSAKQILQTFDASAHRQRAPHHFVRDLQALNLPDELLGLIDHLEASLGTRLRAWALVLQWLAEHLPGEMTLSRQSERLLRQLLKDEDAEVLQQLKRAWTSTGLGHAGLS